MWTYYGVLGFVCSEVCFKNGRCSLIFQVGKHSQLFLICDFEAGNVSNLGRLIRFLKKTKIMGGNNRLHS